jgi:TonB family protein
MVKLHAFRIWISTGLLAVAPVTWADLYIATQADEAKDFPRAFELFRELAELGQPAAQQTLAYKYVTGEGVNRDNVLGLAWAKIAAENGATDAQSIVDQLQPHVTPAAQSRIDEVYARFGPAALKARLLPIESTSIVKSGCSFARPANPDNYYPQGAIQQGLSGEVIVDFIVQPDGRAHTAYTVQSTTPILFDEAARATVMNSTFKPKVANGIKVPCDMRIKVKYVMRGADPNIAVPDVIEEKLPATKAQAQAGDPRAQIIYALVLLRHSQLNEPGQSIMPWALKAAQAGMPDAQYFVGTHAMHGMMVEKDEKKGAAWLALSAKAGYPQAQLALANYIVTTRTDVAAQAEAGALLERAVKFGYVGAGYPLAALLATSPDASLRDPKRALELIGNYMPVVSFDPVPHEIRAAAYAWSNDFDAAVRFEKAALARANKLGWDTTAIDARLASYQAKQAWTGNLMAW